MEIKIAKNKNFDFDNIFFRYYPKTCAFINNIIHNANEAEDLSQEIFTTILERKISLPEIHDIDSYLFISARNAAHHYLRKKNEQHRVVNDDNTIAYKKADDDLIATELKEFIDRFLDTLPNQRRQVFEMYAKEGLSTDEIAKVMDISKRTVENYIYATRHELRDKLILAILLFNIL